MTERRLRLAIQKSGRLADASLDLLKSCGLTVSRGRDKLYARVAELPIDVLLVRDDDIPAFVGDGACDAGIVGGNVFEESELADGGRAHAERVLALGFGRCRLVLAAPKEGAYDGVDSFAGRRIATSYPGILKRFLAEAGVTARAVVMNGAVEVAPRMKIADAICDIVSTGATLDANGLKPVATAYESEAILIRTAARVDAAAEAALEALLKRVRGVIQSRESKYVMMNAPRAALAEISNILPGAEAPTVLDLAGEPDRVAIHAVCRESVFWETMERLKALGASAILVLPIEKMMP